MIVELKMNFGIIIYTTFVIRSNNFIHSGHYENLTFNLGMNNLPNNNQYTYLGIPFNESLNL